MKKYTITLFAALLCTAVAAQKPSIGFVYPCGAQPSTTVELIVGGQNITQATEAVVSGEGVKAELIIDNTAEGKQRNRISKKNIGEEDNLQIAQRLKVRLTIAKDAPLGLRDLRLNSPKGMSNRLMFEIGQLPNFCESEPNSTFADANRIEQLPCTVCGQIMMSDKDFFSFEAQKGHTIVIDVKARHFTPFIADAVPGWFQPVISVCDQTGKEVAYCDDYYYRVDPLILFEAPQTGRYTLQIKDALYRGREDFTYRIDIGELPYVTRIEPMGGNVGHATRITLHGVNLRQTRTTVTPARTAHDKITFHTIGANGLLSNDILFDCSAPEANETTVANHSKTVDIELGDVVNASFSKSCEQHLYRIEIPKRQSIVFEIKARRLGAPTDAKLELLQNGKVIAENDDFEDAAEGTMTHFADPLIVKSLATGIYTLRVTEAQNKFGEMYAYRLYAMARTPDFGLSVEPATITIPRGGSAVLNVEAIRKYRFNGDINMELRGLPNGFTSSYPTIGKGEKRRTLTLTAPMSAKEGALSMRITGRAEDPRTGAKIVREANPVESMMQAFFYTHLVPASQLRIEVVEPQPFSLNVDTSRQPLRYSKGEELPIEVTIARRDGYREPVQLVVRGAKNGGSMECTPVTLTAGQTKATLYVKFNRWRPKSVTSVIITGVVKASGKRVAGQGRQAFTSSVTAIAPAVAVQMPSDKAPKNK